MNPTPAQIKELRVAAELSQPAAAALIHSKHRTWQDWEHGIALMHPGLWELFCMRVTGEAEPTGDGAVPMPDEIIRIRLGARLTQPPAAALIHSTKRTWQDWECAKARMHPGLWELFLLKLDAMTARKKRSLGDMSLEELFDAEAADYRARCDVSVSQTTNVSIGGAGMQAPVDSKTIAAQ